MVVGPYDRMRRVIADAHEGLCHRRHDEAADNGNAPREPRWSRGFGRVAARSWPLRSGIPWWSALRSNAPGYCRRSRGAMSGTACRAPTSTGVTTKLRTTAMPPREPGWSRGFSRVAARSWPLRQAFHGGRQLRSPAHSTVVARMCFGFLDAEWYNSECRRVQCVLGSRRPLEIPAVAVTRTSLARSTILGCPDHQAQIGRPVEQVAVISVS